MFKVVALVTAGLLVLMLIGFHSPPIKTKTKAESLRIKTSMNRVDSVSQ
jgi:hypothetical protein